MKGVFSHSRAPARAGRGALTHFASAKLTFEIEKVNVPFQKFKMSKVLCDFCHKNYTSLGVQKISLEGKGEKFAVCSACEKATFILLIEGDKEGSSYYPIVLTEKGWKPDEEFQRELDTYVYVSH